jgi:hypothetical protein
MKVIKPKVFLPSDIDSVVVVPSDTPWSSGASYVVGSIVVYGNYEVIALVNNVNVDPNVSSDGVSGAPNTWRVIGYINKYKFLDSQVSTQTVSSGNTSILQIQSELIPPSRSINAAALMNIEGAPINGVQFNLTVGSTFYPNIASIVYDDITDWYKYFYGQPSYRKNVVFSNLPPALSENYSFFIQLTNDAALDITPKIGTLILGNLVTLGETQYGAKLGIVDYSRKETDDFGTTTFVRRNFSKRVSCSFSVLNSQLLSVQRILEELRATPCVWIAADGDYFEEASTFLGFYRDFSIDIAYPSHSLCSIEIEGLT